MGNRISRRILIAGASAVALVAGLFVSSPASAVPNVVIPHDTTWDAGQDPTANLGASRLQTNVAMSANGERVVMVSQPHTPGVCTSPRDPIILRAGTVTSGATEWQAPQREVVSGLGPLVCADSANLSVQLSADGTVGIVSWIAGPVLNTQTQELTEAEIRFMTFSWPVSSATPWMSESQTFSPGYQVQDLRVVLAKDGGRAILTAATTTQSGLFNASYSVIDMEHPEFARLLALPGSATAIYPRLRPVVSADSEVAAISLVRMTGAQGFDPFREVKLYTCQANCYPARLKTFTANVPYRQGAAEVVTQMNDAGTRVVLAWSRDSSPVPGANVPARAMRAIVVSPQTSGSAINVTPSIQYFNTFDMARNMFALSSDGTRFVAATDHAGTWLMGMTGSVKVSSGTISPTGKIAVTKTSSVTTQAAPLEGLLLTGAPERVVLTQRENSRYVIHISDSNALKYWSWMYSAATVDPLNIAVSSGAARAIIGWDQNDAQPVTSDTSRVVVTSLLGILGLTAAPKVSGTVAVGKTVSVSAGSWSARGDIAYQWLLDGSAISGQTGPTYDIEFSDAGHQLSVAVTHSKTGYYPAGTFVTAGLVTGGIISAPPLVITGVNSGIDNQPLVGDPIRVDTSLWTPHDGTFTYSWKVGTAVVSTAATYTPRVADLGKRITVTISQTRAGFTKLTKTSPLTAPVAAGR